MTVSDFFEISSANFTSRNVKTLWEVNKHRFPYLLDNSQSIEHWMDIYDLFVGRGKVMTIPHPLEIDENNLVEEGSFCRLAAARRVGLDRLPVRVTCKDHYKGVE